MYFLAGCILSQYNFLNAADYQRCIGCFDNRYLSATGLLGCAFQRQALLQFRKTLLTQIVQVNRIKIKRALGQ